MEIRKLERCQLRRAGDAPQSARYWPGSTSTFGDSGSVARDTTTLLLSENSTGQDLRACSRKPTRMPGARTTRPSQFSSVPALGEGGRAAQVL